jgi:hypothetical protein
MPRNLNEIVRSLIRRLYFQKQYDHPVSIYCTVILKFYNQHYHSTGLYSTVMFFQNRQNYLTFYYCSFRNSTSIPSCNTVHTVLLKTGQPVPSSSSCPVFSEPAQTSHPVCTFRKIPSCCTVQLGTAQQPPLVLLYTQTQNNYSNLLYCTIRQSTTISPLTCTLIHSTNISAYSDIIQSSPLAVLYCTDTANNAQTPHHVLMYVDSFTAQHPTFFLLYTQTHTTIPIPLYTQTLHSAQPSHLVVL